MSNLALSQGSHNCCWWTASVFTSGPQWEISMFILLSAEAKGMIYPNCLQWPDRSVIFSTSSSPSLPVLSTGNSPNCFNALAFWNVWTWHNVQFRCPGTRPSIFPESTSERQQQRRQKVWNPTLLWFFWLASIFASCYTYHRHTHCKTSCDEIIQSQKSCNMILCCWSHPGHPSLSP